MFPSGRRGFVVEEVPGSGSSGAVGLRGPIGVRGEDGEDGWPGPPGLAGSGGGPQDGFWSPLTTGDPINPELIFDIHGDTIAVWT